MDPDGYPDDLDLETIIAQTDVMRVLWRHVEARLLEQVARLVALTDRPR